MLFVCITVEITNIMTNNLLFNQYYRELICKIFILGHSSQGESIVFILYGDKQIIYSCVVDSFIQNSRVVPGDLLTSLKIDKINDLFWTHPHDDHSAGLISLIKKFAPEKIYIPTELHRLTKDNKSESARVLNYINNFNGYDRRRRKQPRVCGLAANMYLYNEFISVENHVVPFQLFAIAPCSGMVRKDSVDDKYSTLNDYSIVLDIIVGDFSILLTGDVQNRTIAFMEEELSMPIYTPNILKIPHHGSKQSTNITDLFDDSEPMGVAVTTAKPSSNLPCDEALRHYSSHCKSVFKVSPPTTHNAIWGAEIDILGGTVTKLIEDNFEKIM